MIDINFILNLLSINNKIVLIGSSVNNQLKYKTDYDCQEIIETLTKKQAYERFKKLFETIEQLNYVYITDFKSGLYNTIPIRWNYKDIKKGYQINENKKINFVDTLNDNDIVNNVIKIDLLVYDDSKKIFLEFSCNYYIKEPLNKNIVNSLFLDVEKYYFEEKYMKVLKRIYSYNLIMNYKETIKKLEIIFNSEAGRINQFLHNINLIIDAIKFNVNKKQINKVIKELNNNIDDKYKKYVKINSLDKLKEILKDDVNEKIFKFFK